MVMSFSKFLYKEVNEINEKMQEITSDFEKRKKIGAFSYLLIFFGFLFIFNYFGFLSFLKKLLFVFLFFSIVFISIRFSALIKYTKDISKLIKSSTEKIESIDQEIEKAKQDSEKKKIENKEILNPMMDKLKNEISLLAKCLVKIKNRQNFE